MVDQEKEVIKKTVQTTELPKISKDTLFLTSARYKTLKTSPLIFHFEPHPFVSSDLRLQDSKIKHEGLFEGLRGE